MKQAVKTRNPLLINDTTISPAVGVIHISDIDPTLKILEKYLGIDLVNNKIGSSGKRLYSGDIDVAITYGSSTDIDQLILKLKSIPDVVSITKSSVIMTVVKIPDYNPLKYTNTNSTGYVQVDFMYHTNIDFLKLYYHSPLERDSKYKGSYRNILLAAIAHYHSNVFSDQKILGDTPLYEERYFWSPIGFYRGMKYSVLTQDKKKIQKKKINTIKSKIYYDADSIVDLLDLTDAQSLDSFETLYSDINSRYSKDLLSKIMAEFLDNSYIKLNGIPTECREYVRN